MTEWPRLKLSLILRQRIRWRKSVAYRECGRESYCLIPNEERLVAVEHAMFTFDDLKVNSHDDRPTE